jgi:glyoxylase-like metal-dependent hydrolase (beta-lactamase superfamily II)
MQRERIAENVYYFQSDLYAQVTAGAVVGPNWAVVIDTLALPEETIQIREFLEQELNIPVRYVVNTHYHADHSWGSCYFPNATVIAHTLCREKLASEGQASLIEARKNNTVFRRTRIILPHITFDDSLLILRVGKKTLSMFPLPGPCDDNIGILVEEDRILFAGDAFMPLPYIVGGNIDDLTLSLKRISKMGLENVVPGHGDIILRGEIDGAIKDNQAYLSAIRKIVRKSARRKYPLDMLTEVGVEECGKSRVLIGGLAEELHRRNLKALYLQLYGESPKANPGDQEEDDWDEDDGVDD